MPLIKQNPDPEKKIEAEVILKYMNRMMANNKNYLCVVTGATGSGKSYSCLRLSELWYKFYFKNREFPIENICFSVEALVKRLNSGKLKKGDVLIAEEIGIGANAKNFQSTTNKALQFILQSFRSLNIIVLFNVPHFSFFDKTARMLMHSHFQTLKIDKQKEDCILKPYFLNISQQTGKIYTKWLRIKRNGITTKITRLRLHKPTKELLIHYEQGKEDFVKTLINEMQVIMAKKVERAGNLPVLTPRQAEVYECLMKGMRTGDIAKELGRSQQDVSQAKMSVKKKGYIWEAPIEIKKIEELEEIKENL